MIPAHKHVAYALGYLELNLLAEAEAELALIPLPQRDTPDVLGAQLEIAMAKSAWTRVITLAPRLANLAPNLERSWICWAYALRERQRIEEARDVLLHGESVIHAPTPLVDYNLACYFCLLGDLIEARRRLDQACSREPAWKTEAATDPDLVALHSFLR